MGFHLPCTDSRSFVGCSFMSTRHHLAPTKTNPCLKGFLIVSKPIKPWSPIIWLTQSYLAYLLPVSHSPSTNTRLWPHLIFFLCTTRVEFYCLKSKNKYMLWWALLLNQVKCATSISPTWGHWCPYQCLRIFLLEPLALVSSKCSTTSWHSPCLLPLPKWIFFSSYPRHFPKYFFNFRRGSYTWGCPLPFIPNDLIQGREVA